MTRGLDPAKIKPLKQYLDPDLYTVMDYK
uniref:Uncharacterized protein n=1 Tax=Arundo donax TaxID=35708 RepID=A0A0A9BWC3_ARUDO